MTSLISLEFKNTVQSYINRLSSEQLHLSIKIFDDFLEIDDFVSGKKKIIALSLVGEVEYG